MTGPKVHPVTLGAMIALAIVVILCLVVAVLSTRTHATEKSGLPPSPLIVYPSICDVPYTLAAGERVVLLCAAPVPRGGLEGVAQIASGNEDVDATLVHRAGRGRFIFAVTNRSNEPITATARGEQW